MNTRYARLPWFVLGVVVLGVVLVAARSALAQGTLPSGEVIADKALIDAAKKEGQVTYYFTTSSEPSEKVLAAFEKRFGLKVNLFRNSGTKLYERFVAESRSGSHQADVMEHSDVVAVERLRAEGFVAPYEPPAAAKIPANMKNPPYWYGIHGTLIGIAWNADEVKDDQAPRAWNDLRSPKWRGKLAVIVPVGGTVFIPNYMWRHALEKDYGLKFWQALRDNDPRFYESQYPAAERLAAGEYAVAAHIIEDAVYGPYSKGAPVRWRFVDPTPLQFAPLIVNKNAPHPNAARLLANWLLSSEAQPLWMEYAGVVTLRPDVPDPRRVAKESWYRKPEKVWVVTNVADYAAKIEPMIQEWKETFKYGK
jgi:iron(III) transport system substrate-binding protein